MEIKGKVVLVTGGLGNLGNGIAEALKMKGAKVIIFDCCSSQNTDTYKVDVTNEKEVIEALSKIEKIDVLVNCAGEIYSEPILNMLKSEHHSKTSWDRVINNNLNSCFVMSVNTAMKMATNRTKGVIINLSSISALGNMGQVAYSVSKAGVEVLTKVFAKELGMFKIRVCSIAPGFIGTQSTNIALSNGMIDYWKKNIPLHKLGEIKDVISTVEFIIENDYMTGNVIRIDGGLTI